jgi:hypothetical protein
MTVNRGRHSGEAEGPSCRSSAISTHNSSQWKRWILSRRVTGSSPVGGASQQVSGHMVADNKITSMVDPWFSFVPPRSGPPLRAGPPRRSASACGRSSGLGSSTPWRVRADLQSGPLGSLMPSPISQSLSGLWITRRAGCLPDMTVAWTIAPSCVWNVRPGRVRACAGTSHVCAPPLCDYLVDRAGGSRRVPCDSNADPPPV